MKTFNLSLAALATMLTLPTLADESRINDLKSQFSKLRVTELPRAAAQAVQSEPGAASDVVAAAVGVNGASAPLIVGSVAKATPQSAAASSSAAVALQPKLAGPIAKAAVSASPSDATAIVSAMCKARPTAFYAIGVSAGEAAPKSADKILLGITEGAPGSKPLVARAQADFAKAKRTATLALLLKHTESYVTALSGKLNQSPEVLLAGNGAVVSAGLASAAFDIPPPVQGPPFVPGGGTPGEITPIPGTVEVPPTGRNYSAP